MPASALYYLTLCAPCALASACGKRYEDALPLSLFALLILNYIAGIAGLLRYGAPLALLLAVACAVAVAVRLAKKRISGKTFLDNFFTPVFTAFTLLFAVAVVCNAGRAFYHGDEFSHWAYAVKAMAYTNDLPTSPAAAALYASYPPGLSLLQYDIERFNAFAGGGVYTEWLLAVPYQTTAFALLLSAVGAGSKWRDAPALLPVLAAVVALPAMLYPLFYESLFPDPIVGLTAGYLLGFAWRAKRYDALTCITLCCGLFTLTLLKDAGLFFAILCGWIAFTDLSRAEKRLRAFTRIGAVAAVVSAKASWSLHVAARNVPVRFSETAPLTMLPGIVTGADTGWRHTAFVNYCKAFFEKRVGLGSEPFAAAGGTVPGWRFTVSFFALAVVLLVLLYAAATRGDRVYTAERSRSNRIAGTLTLGLVVYWVGLCGMYVLKFIEFEAVSLYCYERYLAIPFLMLATLLLAAFAQANTGRLRIVWATLIAVCVLALSPLHSVYPYLSRRAARGSYEMMEPQREIAARVESVLAPDDRLYLLAQGSDGEGLAQRYLLFPRIITGGAIGTPMYEGDAWTQDITCAQWQETLTEGYDYVLLSHVDEAFRTRCGDAFLAPDTIEDGALYAVDPATGLLALVDG